ncbi:hypothetical protein UFOVP89_51 [uncultured Caudovirales phage]|uniref:Uncharacterized protein n=1 Tax=uncultured Caudovirales phage TaxID=2100421 RepID=A0A6J5KZR0_9CAUD|nr:hypothetical protein UFOVP89_51 [uncultured Caudovirales phage]
MGGQTNQPSQTTQVYYDTEKGQYYTIKPQENPNPLVALFGNGRLNSHYINDPANRNYLGSTLSGTASADRFTPKTIAPNYPEMNQLFPALNMGLAQNLQNSLLAPTDTQSSGAGRFLAPSTSSKGK